jgi:hypothetical protein
LNLRRPARPTPPTPTPTPSLAQQEEGAR